MHLYLQMAVMQKGCKIDKLMKFLQCSKYSQIHNFFSFCRVILPSTFTGGPRYMHKRQQDAMTYVRKYGHPDLFITTTTNPNWPEIKDNLPPGQDPQDRPDIVA